MIIWVIVLFLAGMALVFAELIVPGGVCGVIGALLVLISCGLGCYHYPSYAFFIILGEVVAATMAVVFGLYYLPRSFAGKAMILHSSQPAEEGWVAAMSDESLLGASGQAYTKLRPAGVIVVDDRRVDAVSSGDYINKGEQVRVIEVKGSRVVVEPFTPESA